MHEQTNFELAVSQSMFVLKQERPPFLVISQFEEFMLIACWQKVLAWRCLHRYKIEHIYVRAKKSMYFFYVDVHNTLSALKRTHRSTAGSATWSNWKEHALPMLKHLSRSVSPYETATIVTHTVFLGGTASSQQHKTTDPVQHDQMQRTVHTRNNN